MIENLKAVNNPLTIIAIFAALAEIAGTVALAAVDKNLQQTFVWFVMAFPTLIVVLFFATLNFNPKVLYAPSDFRDEENFLSTLIGTRGLSLTLDQVSAELENAKAEILQQAATQLSAITGAERAQLTELINREMARIEARVASARHEAAAVVIDAAGSSYAQSELQGAILQALSDNEGHSLTYITRRTGVNAAATERALIRLVRRGLVVHKSDISGDDVYNLAPRR